MKGTTWCFQGVRPKCLQNRWTNCILCKRTQTLDIHVHASDNIGADVLVCHSVKVPESIFKERIIGPLVCIGAKDDLYVVQYITTQCSYIRFLFIDTTAGTSTTFEDRVHYFNKDFVTEFPVECLINPTTTRILFRLPQSILSLRKWSKMLVSDIRQGSCGTYMSSDIYDARFRDRRNQTVCFDPRFPSRVVYMLVNEYCSDVKITVVDVENENIVKQENRQLLYKASGSDPFRPSLSDVPCHKEDFDSDSDSENEQFRLIGCNGDFCQSGEYMALLCSVERHALLKNKGLLKVFVFDANLFNIQIIHSQMFHLAMGKHTLTFPSFSRCDTSFSIRFGFKGQMVHQLPGTVEIPKPGNLQAICRMVILQHCQPKNLCKLGLPQKLHSFLRFSFSSKPC